MSNTSPPAFARRAFATHVVACIGQAFACYSYVTAWTMLMVVAQVVIFFVLQVALLYVFGRASHAMDMATRKAREQVYTMLERMGLPRDRVKFCGTDVYVRWNKSWTSERNFAFAELVVAAANAATHAVGGWTIDAYLNFPSDDPHRYRRLHLSGVTNIKQTTDPTLQSAPQLEATLSAMTKRWETGETCATDNTV